MPAEHDPREHRFSLPDAHLDYSVVDDHTLEFHHTFVDPSRRGRGLAAEVVRAALDHARAEGKGVIPSCSYVRAFFRRHPEYEDLER